MSKLHDRRTICSDHKRRCGWRIATLPVPGCGRVPTNTVYTRGIHSRVTEVHSGGFEKRCTCHLAAAPLIIMRRAYLPSDDGGPTWRWARCAYSYFLFRRLLTGDSTDGTSAIVPPSWTCPASFLDDATRKGWREEKKKMYERTKKPNSSIFADLICQSPSEEKSMISKWCRGETSFFFHLLSCHGFRFSGKKIYDIKTSIENGSIDGKYYLYYLTMHQKKSCSLSKEILWNADLNHAIRNKIWL